MHVQVFARSSKFSLFDPAKEMAYIQMSRAEKRQGKAAVDLIGSQARPLPAPSTPLRFSSPCFGANSSAAPSGSPAKRHLSGFIAACGLNKADCTCSPAPSASGF